MAIILAYCFFPVKFVHLFTWYGRATREVTILYRALRGSNTTHLLVGRTFHLLVECTLHPLVKPRQEKETIGLHFTSVCATGSNDDKSNRTKARGANICAHCRICRSGRAFRTSPAAEDEVSSPLVYYGVIRNGITNWVCDFPSVPLIVIRRMGRVVGPVDRAIIHTIAPIRQMDDSRLQTILGVGPG